MKILVVNIGSTSFKYRLYDMPSETLLARGGVERIGEEASRSYVLLDGNTIERIAPVPDHGSALAACIEQLTDPNTGCLSSADQITAIGFKAVHAGDVSAAPIVDERVLEAMEKYSIVAPAHNPPYIRAMRQLRERFPQIPLVAAFETGFHQTAPPAYRTYAIPYEWTENLGIRRYGFHGASHRFIAQRIAEVTGRQDLKVISCHLGGSSSLCAIDAGKSLGATMGMSPQSGLPNNNRAGDFDPFAIPLIERETGLSLTAILDRLASDGGLKGIGGVGADLRDVETAADAGNSRAQLAIDVLVASIRDYLGAFLVRLGRIDAIVFTGGIGENSNRIRAAVCHGLEAFGIVIDDARNKSLKGEGVVSADKSSVSIWIMPTNEEIVVARQTVQAVAPTKAS
jgi:acetate kinase